MENIIIVKAKKFRSRSATRSLEHFREILSRDKLDEWDIKHFGSVDGMIDAVFLNNLTHAYQTGISAGIKLAGKSGMNEIDAVTFTIKQLQQVKDDLKTKTADDIIQS